MSPSSSSLPPLRPPSVPLVVSDPYFSVWSPADRLTDAETVHWTGSPYPLHSMIRIGAETYRLMGSEPSAIPAMPQTSVAVHPTRTIYTFENAAATVALTFTTAALPSDLMVFSRPVTYLTWTVAVKGAAQLAALYFDASPLLTVNTPEQEVTLAREELDGRPLLKVGSVQQPVLQKKGDNLRIDWGYMYAVAAETEGVTAAFLPRDVAVNAFAAGRELPVAKLPASAPAGESASPVLRFDLGRVSGKAVSRTALLAYDDLYSIEYFKERLRPYWRRNGDDAHALLRKSLKEATSLLKQCAAFDDGLMKDLRNAGGEKYARIASLAYRQTTAASKLTADAKGGPLLFHKENFSNGCIATVDLLYPMAPQILLSGSGLTRALLTPVLDYSSSPRWKFDFAPHDLGTYPKANGQVYGGGERTEENQMPVEETGNILIVTAALAHSEGNADYAAKYWPTLKKWAEYLKEKGLDPENQLSTDDFAGHLAHNVNLSVKAILGMRAYAQLCAMRGMTDEAKTYTDLTREYVKRWMEMADNGDHYRLAFDRPDTWSQKYNLVWDRILGYNLYPASVREKEMAFYRKQQNRYGLPLDVRQPYTKLDWTLWTATLGTRDDFDALVAPVYDFLNDTSNRVPLSDWYQTKTAKQVGFQARSVVGGVFLPLLYNPAVWKLWVKAGATVPDDAWAPFPKPPVTVGVLPSSQETGQTWRYTTEKPSGDWFTPGFEDSGWKEGLGGFGVEGTPGSVVRTTWDTDDLWLRREITLPDPVPDNLALWLHHDEDVEVYLNGVLAAQLPGFVSEYETFPITETARKALRPGQNSVALHVHQTGGGQYVDLGFVRLVPGK